MKNMKHPIRAIKFDTPPVVCQEPWLSWPAYTELLAWSIVAALGLMFFCLGWFIFSIASIWL